MDAHASDQPLFMGLHDADPVVIQALSEAKEALPRFLDAVARKRFPMAMSFVKVPIIDRSDSGEPSLVRTPETESINASRPICHLWVRVDSVFEDLIFCSIVEAPEALRLKRGASLVIERMWVEDWLINDNGTAYGGFSLRLMRSRLSNHEQLRFDAHTGIREFKVLG